MNRSGEARIPTTRWAAAEQTSTRYLQHFGELIDTGSDVDGEARLADALVGRGARILDAGSGMGRVGIALQRRGHEVLAAEPDQALVVESHRRWPQLRVLTKDILELDPATVGTFDLILAVGNVMILAGEGTEVRVLATLRAMLRPEGRILVGFHLADEPPEARHDYTWDRFAADASEAGLDVQHRFGGYGLEPAGPGYCVAILTAR